MLIKLLNIVCNFYSKKLTKWAVLFSNEPFSKKADCQSYWQGNNKDIRALRLQDKSSQSNDDLTLSFVTHALSSNNFYLMCLHRGYDKNRGTLNSLFSGHIA